MSGVGQARGVTNLELSRPEHMRKYREDVTVNEPSTEILEREHKFLLDPEQYGVLWQRLRPGAFICVQENLFFDENDLLRRIACALRLRVERGPGEALEAEALLVSPSLSDLDWPVANALVTLKGPSTVIDGSVVRSEHEADVDPLRAREAAATGRLPRDLLPAGVEHALSVRLPALPEVFSLYAGFKNLRLRRHASGTIEVALDRALAVDGRIRHELEVEWSPGDEHEVERILSALDTGSLTRTFTSKLSWARGEPPVPPRRSTRE
jgi:hypothetical protein